MINDLSMPIQEQIYVSEWPYVTFHADHHDQHSSAPISDTDTKLTIRHPKNRPFQLFFNQSVAKILPDFLAVQYVKYSRRCHHFHLTLLQYHQSTSNN